MSARTPVPWWAIWIAILLSVGMWFLFVAIIFWNVEALVMDGWNYWNVFWLLWGISGVIITSVSGGIRNAKAWERLRVKG